MFNKAIRNLHGKYLNTLHSFSYCKTISEKNLDLIRKILNNLKSKTTEVNIIQVVKCMKKLINLAYQKNVSTLLVYYTC